MGHLNLVRLSGRGFKPENPPADAVVKLDVGGAPKAADGKRATKTEAHSAANSRALIVVLPAQKGAAK